MDGLFMLRCDKFWNIRDKKQYTLLSKNETKMIFLKKEYGLFDSLLEVCL